MYDDDDDISPILTLPQEIRGQIFSLLETKDVTRCRLVCRQFKTDVDEYAKFSVELDETKGTENGLFLPSILKLRLDEIFVKHLVEPHTWDGQDDTQTKLLRYPKLLRQLKVSRDSEISVDNLHYLLNTAFSLRVLKLSLSQRIATASTALGLSPATFSYNLKKLKTFCLKFSTDPEWTEEEGEVEVEEDESLLPDDSIPILLLSSKINSIRSIEIEFSSTGVGQLSQIAVLVLQLIAKCWATLTSVSVFFDEDKDLTDHQVDLIDMDVMTNVDLIAFDRICSLEEIYFYNPIGIGARWWKQLLENQKKLVRIQTLNYQTPLNMAMYRQVLLNNTSTLVSVVIEDLKLDMDQNGVILPFDMSIFRDCFQLRLLQLERIDIEEGVMPEETQLVQLSQLPKSLSTLTLGFLNITSEELLLYINTQGQNLTSIDLSSCGSSGMFGVTGSVLQAIVTHPTLQDIMISPPNRTPGEELQKLNQILVKLGFPEGYHFIKLQKKNYDDRPSKPEDASGDEAWMDDLKFEPAEIVLEYI